MGVGIVESTSTRTAWVPKRDVNLGISALVPLDAAQLPCTVCGRAGIAAYAPAAQQVIDFKAPYPAPEYALPHDLFFCAPCVVLIESGAWPAAIERRLAEIPTPNPETSAGDRRRYVTLEFELIRASLNGRDLTFVDTPVDCRFTYRTGFEPGSLPTAPATDERLPDCHAWLDRSVDIAFEQVEVLKEAFRHLYSYAIPNRAALDAIARHSPKGVVEICAGNGYWLYLMRNAGISGRSLEPFPVQGSSNPYWRGWPAELRRTWAPVDTADESGLRPDDHDRTLLLIWPPENRSVGNDALLAYQGDTVCYIGEWRAMTGNLEFHNALRVLWALVETVRIPTFFGFFDQLLIFKRRAPHEVQAIVNAYRERHLVNGAGAVAPADPTT